MREPIKVKDLDPYDFIRYLEQSEPQDLDIFGQDSEAELRIDPYGLPPKTVRQKRFHYGEDFPQNPGPGDYYTDLTENKTWCYNASTCCWILRPDY